MGLTAEKILAARERAQKTTTASMLVAAVEDAAAQQVAQVALEKEAVEEYPTLARMICARHVSEEEYESIEKEIQRIKDSEMAQEAKNLLIKDQEDKRRRLLEIDDSIPF